MRRRIEAHLRWLRKELALLDGELKRVVEESLVCKERATLLMSVPGVGPTLSATLLAELPERCQNWSTSTAGASPRW